jgi:arylformamidase
MINFGKITEVSHRLRAGQEEFPLEIETLFTDEAILKTGRESTHTIERGKDIWYILQELKIGSHLGTHIEFPYHHVKSGKSAADYPLERMIGDAVLLDFSHKKKDEEISKQEILDLNADIREGDILIVRTDMDKLWNTPKGHDRPCLSIEATEYLVHEVKIHCIATDATGLEVRGRDDQPVHELLFHADVAMVESLKDLDKIKSERFTIIMLPLMIEGMDACPIRAIICEEE